MSGGFMTLMQGLLEDLSSYVDMYGWEDSCTYPRAAQHQLAIAGHVKIGQVTRQ